jgi:rod shape-determining protein MreB
MRLIQPTGYVQVFKNKLVFQVPADHTLLVFEANFSHPRMLVGDYAVAQQLMTLAMKQAYPTVLFPATPRVVMHPKEVLEGGFTEIEVRVLKEMALAAGARAVAVWQGADLSTDEVAAFKF